jgi:hypothetical protein
MRPLGEARAYVPTCAIIGAIRGAMLENSPLLRSQEFKEELVQLAAEIRCRADVLSDQLAAQANERARVWALNCRP